MKPHRHLAGLALLVLFVALVEGCASGPPPTPTELAEQALLRGDWRMAQRQFEVVLHTDPRNGRAWLGAARAHLVGHDPEQALSSLGMLARVDPLRFKGEARPTYADALEGVTKLRLARKQTPSALVAVRALAKLDPERRGLNRILGDVILAEADRLRLRGDRQAAFALFQEATRVVPQMLSGWIGAAEMLIESEQGKGAVRLLESARQYHPASGEIRMLTIQALGAP
jgi:tetratricopeptide (TPR) repeat protein